MPHQRLATSAILGSTDMARTEYALQQLSREAAGRGWDANLFHEVLTGIRSDPALLGKVLTFDCCVLYACWEVVHAPEEDPDPDVLFGHLPRLREVRRLVNKERGTHHYLQDDKDTEKASSVCSCREKECPQPARSHGRAGGIVLPKKRRSVLDSLC